MILNIGCMCQMVQSPQWGFSGFGWGGCTHVLICRSAPVPCISIATLLVIIGDMEEQKNKLSLFVQEQRQSMVAMTHGLMKSCKSTNC